MADGIDLPVYAVLNPEGPWLVRHGHFGHQLYPDRESAAAVAEKEEHWKVVEVSDV